MQFNALFPHCLFVLASWLLQKPTFCASRYFALKLQLSGRILIPKILIYKSKRTVMESLSFSVRTSHFCCILVLKQAIKNITCYIFMYSWFILIHNWTKYSHPRSGVLWVTIQQVWGIIDKSFMHVHGSVAQWIRRLPTEQEIVGSSPAWVISFVRSFGSFSSWNQ